MLGLLSAACFRVPSCRAEALESLTDPDPLSLFLEIQDTTRQPLQGPRRNRPAAATD